MSVASYIKALAGGAVTALGVLATEIADGTLTAQDYIYAAIAFLTGLGIVYVSPANKPKP